MNPLVRKIMISHKYKCIFIHIQRTAGSSVESWICKKHWWTFEPETKYILASQAKELYKDYWDEYFKFSIVRNPWDRMVSYLRFSGMLRIKNTDKTEFGGYKKKFGYPTLIEFDHRFYDLENLRTAKHQKECVYLNVLDEELNFIAKFENLKEDMRFIQGRIGIKEPFDINAGKPEKKSIYQEFYNEDTIKEVEDLYKKDIECFNYKFETA